MQKPLQQLDLFGMPIEPPAPKKKQSSKAAPSAPVLSEKVAAAPEPIPVPPTPPPITEPVVFADEKIVVKIKAKNPEPVVASANPVTKTGNKRGRKSFREIDSEIDLIDIPEEEVLNQKLYYSISEVAGWFKVNTSLLRYWENEFDILKPRKTRKGDRLFRVEDIRNLQLIYFLLRQRKFSIEGARNYLKQNKEQADKQVQLVQSLTHFKSFLLELKAGLTR